MPKYKCTKISVDHENQTVIIDAVNYSDFIDQIDGSFIDFEELPANHDLPLYQKYNNRGLSDALISRVSMVAYEQCHAYGEEEVDLRFCSLMSDIFCMEKGDMKPVKLD